jgi:hypothetical protein
MSVEYDPAKYETLVTDWFLRRLRSEPDELEKMFHSSLRSLTDILWWAANKVKLVFEFDEDGISMAAWLSPYMSGAEVGVWIRKDKRTAYQSVIFVNRFYKAALQHYPVLIGITQRPELEKIHLALGYRLTDPPIPALFDGHPARVYYMTAETRKEARANRKQRQDKHVIDQQRVRAPAPEPVQLSEADPKRTGESDGGRSEDWWSKQPAPGSKRKRRSRTRGVQPAHPEPAQPTGDLGAGK